VHFDTTVTLTLDL